GEHRLKDLTAPERIYQLGDTEHPPLKTLHQTNLPIPATPFLGRESELTEIGALLGRDDVRLVTLTGPGGTGKTRLALQAAASAADAYPGGVWWVPLAALRDPALVLESTAKALGAPGQLVEHIGDTRLLLLLDNFEHLVEAAAGLALLMASCPRLTLLVTSREPLHLDGEWEYTVDPLNQAEAIELFTMRARAVRRDFEANGEVGQICARLDNLPLAIELAAARAKVMSASALLDRLEKRLPVLAGGGRDAPERQRTLRATIEWSHELLTAEEQRLFARLAVFRGGCTIDAAETVADADLDPLQSLVDKSLLRVRGDRFWMLETIREFAAERLEASGEADGLRQRHADFFLALAEEAEDHVRQDSIEWLDRLQADHDNLRAALDWLEATAAGDLVLRLAGALWRFWYQKSHLLEARRRLEAAVLLDASPTAGRAKALHGASVATLNLGDTIGARRYAEEALELERALGNAWGVAYASMMIGNSLAEADGESRDLVASRPRLEESVRLFRELGDQHYALIANLNLAWVTGDLGDVAGERRLHEQNLITARSIGNAGIEAETLAQMGMLARDDGRLDEAAAMVREAVRIDHRRGMVLNLATQLGRLSSVLVRLGHPTTAGRLIASSQALTEQVGADVAWWARRRNDETISMIRSKLDNDAAERAFSDGRLLTVDEAVALALDDHPAD
ncbi:MAG TPA: hypothetical protein VGP30_07460, partial [Candidatus Limnocylindrales bacterium]|nr:hypothetical protein [Candidatus Limnocylindrales bacterium]